MSPSPNTSGNAGSSGNPLSLASDAATVLHPYRQNRRREVLITNANLRGQPNAVEATPGRTTGPFLARQGVFYGRSAFRRSSSGSLAKFAAMRFSCPKDECVNPWGGRCCPAHQ
jgi:hypothetical protein